MKAFYIVLEMAAIASSGLLMGLKDHAISFWLLGLAVCALLNQILLQLEKSK